jgi:ABC-2 type transport system ATP-binding protein
VGSQLELSQVSKRYRRGPLVLDGVSFALETGTLTQVRGGNGSGKSTLLRVACGFTRPTDGHVRRGFATLAYVPDRAVPPPRMSALTYLRQLGRLAGMKPSAIVGAAESITGALGLVPGLHAPLGELSRGNQRKVLLAQALMRPAPLVVLDEPFTALDAEAAAALSNLLQDRLSEGAALLVALHGDELGDAGHVLALEEGRLRDVGGDGVGAEDRPTVTVELAGPQPDGVPGGEVLADGRVRYRVAEGDVDRFLTIALAAGSRVRRVDGSGGR